MRGLWVYGTIEQHGGTGQRLDALLNNFKKTGVRSQESGVKIGTIEIGDRDRDRDRKNINEKIDFDTDSDFDTEQKIVIFR